MMGDEKKKYIRLLLVRIKRNDSILRTNDIIPVIMPTKHGISVGDYVFFSAGEVEHQGEVLFEDYTYEGDDTWRMSEILTGLVPFRATKYAYVSECDWKDE